MRVRFASTVLTVTKSVVPTSDTGTFSVLWLADELTKLQDRVPPFDSAVAVSEIERSLGRSIEAIFQSQPSEGWSGCV